MPARLAIAAWTMSVAAGCATPVTVSRIRPETATPAATLAATEAWRTLAQATDEAEIAERLERYNASLEALFNVPGADLSTEYFDELIIAHDVRVDGLEPRHKREGVGLPMIGYRRNQVREPIERYYPPEGITRPVTALVRVTPEGEAELELLDATRVESVRAGNFDLPLAADFTAPYAWLLSRTKFGRLRLSATRDSNVYEGRTGVYLLETYDPAKIPVLMVHGLVSSPVTWRELTNAVFGTADLRAEYQVWHYVYPTGIPYLHAAATFRRDLDDLRRFVDADRAACTTEEMVVVAHSKGGLLAKTLVADSGTLLWDVLFKAPPESLEGDAHDIAVVRSFLFFERDTGVRRVVFIATPHRGSRTADNPVARLAASFVKRPEKDAAALSSVMEANAALLTDRGAMLRARGLPSGPRALSPSDPLLQYLAELPIDAAVTHHTIVGDRRAGAGTDGVVQHDSSHQAGAASELLVPDAGHQVHSDPRAIAEVVRVLREHLRAARSRGCPTRT